MSSEQWLPEVEEGERVLWTGRPERYTFLDEPVKKRVLLTWGIGGAVILIALILVLTMMRQYELMPRVIFLIFICLTPFCIILNTFRDFHGLDKAQYALTDRRVFVKTPYMEYKYPLNKGTELREDRANRAVLIGEAVKLKPSSVRTCMLVNSMRNTDGETTGVALYNLGRPEQVLELLHAQVG